jgi:hypothetical protein
LSVVINEYFPLNWKLTPKKRSLPADLISRLLRILRMTALSQLTLFSIAPFSKLWNKKEESSSSSV